MSSNGEVHGAKLQRENTALTAACLNEGSKTSISRSHEMKGKIVDVHPVAPPPQKNGRLLTQKTVSEGERETQTDGEMQGFKKRNEERITQVRRFKGQEHHEYENIKRKGDDEVRIGRQIR